MTWIGSTAAERRTQIGRFVLGAGGLGGIAGITGPGIGLSETDGHRLVDRAIGEGFKILDTADIYAGGASERILGAWNRAHPGASVLIQSKTGVTPDGPDLSPERIRRQLDHSIEVLGRVDLYLAHQVDPGTPWSESLPVFSSAVEKGTIRAYGLSNVDEAALTTALDTADRLGLARPELIQNQYSLVARDDDKGVLPIVASQNLAYTPYSPLANGVLAGRYSRGERPEHGSRASTSPRAGGLLGDDAVMARVREFDRLAEEHDVTPAGLALAWLINHPVVTAPIVGPSKDSHWLGIHESTRLTWTPTLQERLDDLFG
ncbi:aldo/keto reductase [Actinoplanes sp. HUAS TT8]|uniref:aldo/keto reductase n=1 Tax=Actinoplanes sp. HUAS TT8 TaxID=3447453 RepID=UPI003F51D1A0